MPWYAKVKREEIVWFPLIDPEKCVKCGICMNCGKNVFTWGEDGKPFVAQPLECVVGCSTCANLCMGDAITFPPLDQLREFYRKNKIWAAVRRELVTAGKIPVRSKKKTAASPAEVIPTSLISG